MHPVEKGVAPESSLYFYTCSELARDIFFYPLCTGFFRCYPGYRVERKNYDSYLILYAASGSGYVQEQGRKIPVHAGEFLLVDCCHPHCYGTDTGWEIWWLHFDGTLARRYFELCTKGGSVLMPDSSAACQRQLRKIFEMFHNKEKVSEPEISRRITFLLTELMQTSPGPRPRTRAQTVIEESLAFISENLTRNITLEQIAAHAALSPYYFSRLFKRETGYSPHDYLIQARINKAKYLLKSTDMPLKEIADSCGFSNASNFSASFRQVNGCTPLSYRNEHQ